MSKLPQIINGFDITSYSTDPNHFHIISEIVDYIQRHYPRGMSAIVIDSYMVVRASETPLTGQMFVDSSSKYGLGQPGLQVLVATVQVETMFSTLGIGARLKNPGNYNDRDDGHTQEFSTYEDGLDAIAGWLVRHNVTA